MSGIACILIWGPNSTTSRASGSEANRLVIASGTCGLASFSPLLFSVHRDPGSIRLLFKCRFDAFRSQLYLCTSCLVYYCTMRAMTYAIIMGFVCMEFSLLHFSFQSRPSPRFGGLLGSGSVGQGGRASGTGRGREAEGGVVSAGLGHLRALQPDNTDDRVVLLPSSSTRHPYRSAGQGSFLSLITGFQVIFRVGVVVTVQS